MVIVGILALLAPIIQGIVVLVAVVAVCYTFYLLYKFVRTKIEKMLDNKLKAKKEKVMAELSEEIASRQEKFAEIESFFSQRKEVIVFLKLITDCSGTTSVLECYEDLENDAFNKLRDLVVDKHTKKKDVDFPISISDIGSFVSSKNKEIEQYKNALSAVAGADSTELEEIILTHCKKLKKENMRKKAKKIMLLVSIVLAILTLIIVLSNGFALVMAENYHKSVINEVLNEQGYKYLIVDDIEYEEKESYYDTELHYEISVIKLLSTVSNPAEFTNDFYFEEYELSNAMAYDIYYNWAGKKLEFENKEDVIIVITDIDGEEISID